MLFETQTLSGRAGVSMNLEIKFSGLDHELMDTLIWETFWNQQFINVVHNNADFLLIFSSNKLKRTTQNTVFDDGKKWYPRKYPNYFLRNSFANFPRRIWALVQSCSCIRFPWCGDVARGNAEEDEEKGKGPNFANYRQNGTKGRKHECKMEKGPGFGLQ